MQIVQVRWLVGCVGKNNDFDLRVAEKDKQKSQNGDAESLLDLFSLA